MRSFGVGVLVALGLLLVVLPTALAVTGAIDVLVAFAAFSDTPDDVKFRVPYPADSATPNFYPSNVTGSYGPVLGVNNDDNKAESYNYYPMDEVNTYFKLLTFGQLSFSTVTYSQVQLDGTEGDTVGVGDSALTLAAKAVLDKLTELSVSYSSKYVIIVVPDIDTGDVNEVYSVYDSKTLLLNGYEHFYIKDAAPKYADLTDLTNYPGLIGVLGELFGLDPADYEGYLKFDDEPRGDDTDVMGTGGEEGLAFTNPANLIKAGWLDSSWTKRITRSGVYRVYPLRYDNLTKDYDFDLFTYDASSVTDYYDENTDKTPRVLIFDGLQSSGSSPDYYAWIRTETSYKKSNVSNYERYTVNFERELLVHEYQVNETLWINPSAYGNTVTNAVKGVAGLRVNETFLSFNTSKNAVNAPCRITPICRDTGSVPSSLLVQAECITALPNVITGFARQFSASINAEYRNDTFLIPTTASFWTVTMATGRIQSFGGLGYLGFALPGTGCSGASTYKIDLDSQLDTKSFSLSLTSSYVTNYLFSRFSRGKAIAICWAEDVSQGNDDSFFTEQIYAPTVFLQPADEYFSNVCTGDLGCNWDICTDSNLTSSGECGCANAGSILPVDGCCFGNAQNSSWSNAGFPTCGCKDGFAGTYCHYVTGTLYTVDISPKNPFEGGELYFQGQLAAPPLPTDFPTLSSSNIVTVNLVCGATKSTGEFIGNISTVPFTNSYTLINQLYRFKVYNFEVIKIQEDWAPYIIVNCILSAPSTVLNYQTGYSTTFNITIQETADLQPPTNVRVYSYGATGNVTLAWDEPDAVEFLTDVKYYIEYKVVGDTTWSRSANTTTPRLTLDLVENTEYVATVTLIHSEAGVNVSDSFYFRTSETSTACVADQYPTCSSSNCNSTYGYCENEKCHCKGFFHGPDCSVSGCLKTSSSSICSGNGVCTGLTAHEGFCECDEYYYGMFCDKVDWSTFKIEISNPGTFIAGQSRELTWSVPYTTTGFRFYKRFASPGQDITTKTFDDGSFVAPDTVNAVVVSIPLHGFDLEGTAQFKVVDLSWPGVYGILTVTTTRPSPATAAPTASGTPSGEGGSDKSFGDKLFDEYLGYTIGVIIGVAILVLGGTVGTCFLLRRNAAIRAGTSASKAVVPGNEPQIPGVETPL